MQCTIPLNTNETQTNKPIKNPHGSTETPKTDVRGRIRIVESIACRPYLLCNFHPNATPTKDRPRKYATAQPEKQQKPTQQTAPKTIKNDQGQTSRSSRENAKLEWLSERNLAEFLIGSCNYRICIISLHPLAGERLIFTHIPNPLAGKSCLFIDSRPPSSWMGEYVFSNFPTHVAGKICFSHLPPP